MASIDSLERFIKLQRTCNKLVWLRIEINMLTSKESVLRK